MLGLLSKKKVISCIPGRKNCELPHKGIINFKNLINEKKEKIETIVIGFGRIAYGYNRINKINFLTHFKALISNKNFSIIGMMVLQQNLIMQF